MAHRIKSVSSDDFRSQLGRDEKSWWRRHKLAGVGKWEAGTVGQLLGMMVLRLTFGPK